MDNKFEIEVETKGIDEMNEKMETAVNNAEDLAEALEFPSITIKQSKNCTFNISINKTAFHPGERYIKQELK